MVYTSTQYTVIAENVFLIFSFYVILQCPENLKLKIIFYVDYSYLRLMNISG